MLLFVHQVRSRVSALTRTTCDQGSHDYINNRLIQIESGSCLRLYTTCHAPKQKALLSQVCNDSESFMCDNSDKKCIYYTCRNTNAFGHRSGQCSALVKLNVVGACIHAYRTVLGLIVHSWYIYTHISYTIFMISTNHYLMP